jgi:hypothetical protein
MSEKLAMIMDLKESVHWIERLISDLELGRAQVVPTHLTGHVWEHLLEEVPAGWGLSLTGEQIPMMSRTVHSDILKLWGFYVYIATCPKTGIRFVEKVVSK